MCQDFVHQFQYQSLFVRRFQSLGFRGFQTVVLFVQYVGMFLQVLCILFVRGFYGLHVGIGSSLRSYVFCQRVLWFGCRRVFSCIVCCCRFWYRKVSLGPFLFLWFYSLCQRVSSGSLYLSVLGVKRLLQVHCFGMSEVSALVLQLEVLVSNDFKVYLTKAFVKKSIRGSQRLRCLFL